MATQSDVLSRSTRSRRAAIALAIWAQACVVHRQSGGGIAVLSNGTRLPNKGHVLSFLVGPAAILP